MNAASVPIATASWFATADEKLLFGVTPEVSANLLTAIWTPSPSSFDQLRRVAEHERIDGQWRFFDTACVREVHVLFRS